MPAMPSESRSRVAARLEQITAWTPVDASRSASDSASTPIGSESELESSKRSTDARGS
jgi:hypothetical protein